MLPLHPCNISNIIRLNLRLAGYATTGNIIFICQLFGKGSSSEFRPIPIKDLVRHLMKLYHGYDFRCARRTATQ
ncbi:hypothetical protein CS542_02480 [Pedobacter sp. IW39]|nr:hypothetical protein CS542_02480 [Pedobacter sp. IW39]